MRATHARHLDQIIEHTDVEPRPSDMAKMKNRHNALMNVPPGQKPTPCWFYFLSAHALIHGGFVWIFTGLWALAVAEMVLHWVIDFVKCENWTGVHLDQSLHIACKLVWMAVYFSV